MSKLAQHSSIPALWHALVNDAENAAKQPLDQELESYLVFLLMRHSDRPEIAKQIMALDYLNSMQAFGASRERQLRQVADSCLIFAGLYPQQAQRRQVQNDYFINLGRSAYLHLAELTRDGIAELYSHLSQAFVQVMDVLSAIRHFNDKPDRQQVMLLHDLWQKSGSQYSYRQLLELEPSMVTAQQSAINH